MKQHKLISILISMVLITTSSSSAIASHYHNCDQHDSGYHTHHHDPEDEYEEYYDEYYDLDEVYYDDYYVEHHDYIDDHYFNDHTTEHDDVEILGALMLGGIIGHVLTKDSRSSKANVPKSSIKKSNKVNLSPGQYYQSGKDGNCYLMKKSKQSVRIISMVPKHSCQ